MARRLAGTVALLNPGTYRTEVFGPGAAVPAWAEAHITNPDLWEDTPAGAASHTVEEPPRAGRGSSRQAWEDYARTVGVQVPDDASRDDIVAAVDAQGG